MRYRDWPSPRFRGARTDWPARVGLFPSAPSSAASIVQSSASTNYPQADLRTASILAHLLVYSHFFSAARLSECTMSNSWAEQVALGSDAGLWTWRSKAGERRLHDHPHTIRAMEAAGQNIAGAARPFGRPLLWRTFFPFSRAERSPLRRCAGVRCRTRLDCQHVVGATR